MEYVSLKKYRTRLVYRRGMSNRVSRLLDRKIRVFRDRLAELPEYIRVLVAGEIDLSCRN